MQPVEPKSQNSKKKRIYLFIGLFVFVDLIIITAFFLYNRKTTPTSTPAPSSRIIQAQSPLPRASDSPSYFVGKVETLFPVIGFTWVNDNLIYATKEGIYEAGTNTPLLVRPISYISFAKNGDAVLANGNLWYVYRHSDKSVSQIAFQGNNPHLSFDFTKLVWINKNSVNIYDLSKNTNQTVTAKNTIETLTLANNTGLLAVKTQSNTSPSIEVYDFGLIKKSDAAANKDDSLLGITPDGQYLAISNLEELDIRPSANPGKTEIKFTFTPGSTLQSSWISNNRLIVIETLSADPAGRKINYIWSIGKDGSKLFLVDSKPIPGKINTIMPASINFSQNAIALAEKNGAVWLVSLAPGKFPYYTAAGFSLYPLKKDQYVDQP